MNPVLLKSYDVIALAEMEKGLLEAEGIKCLIKKGTWGLITGGASSGGADLFVLEKDLARAKEILSND